MKTRSVPRRVAAFGAAAALAAGALALLAPASPAQTVRAQTLAPSAASAITWLEGELADSGHRLQTTFDGQAFDDIGLTIDGVLAIASAGRNSDAEAKATSDYVVAHAKDYFSSGEDRYAGPLGKVMLFAQARGLSTTDVGGFNLENELRGRLQASGRFTDKSSFGDFSNGVGQSLDMMALSRTPDGVPANAVTWLLAQQCPNGGFRIDYQEGVACTSDDDADLDATSFALLALSVSNLTEAQDAKIDEGLDFIFANQESNGLIGNGNSSGLAASVLRTFGLVPDANKVAAGVATLQLTTGNDAGAIALDPGEAQSAKTNGVSDAKREKFQRVTTQAVLALGLPSYVDRGKVPPVEPKPHAASSAASAKAGDSVTVTGGGFLEGETVGVTVESDPVSVGSTTADHAGEIAFTFVLPSTVPAGSHTIRLAGATSAVNASAPLTVNAAQVASTTTTPITPATTNTTIVRTGSRTGDEASVGFTLVGAGAALALATRRRRIVYPFKK